MSLRRRRPKRDPVIVDALENFARLHRRQALTRFAVDVGRMMPGFRSAAKGRVLKLIEKHEDPSTWGDR